MSAPERLIVGITGASGAIYGIRLLEVLQEASVQSHLVMTETARRVIELETGRDPGEVEALATTHYANDDLEASIASGSFLSMGMAVAPCSIKSLSAIAHCRSETLLMRAADVTLKERRRLVLAVRETPLHLGHLRLMTTVTEYGAVVFPPAPGFYHRPQTVDEIIDHTVGKILDQFEVEHGLYRRWEGEGDDRRRG